MIFLHYFQTRRTYLYYQNNQRRGTRITKNFITDGDIFHILLPTDISSYLSPNAKTRSTHSTRNFQTTWNSYETLVHRICSCFIQLNLILWPGPSSLCLPKDVTKRMLLSAASLATIALKVKTKSSLTLVITTHHLIIHITFITQLTHPPPTPNINAVAAKLSLFASTQIILLLLIYLVFPLLPTRHLFFHADLHFARHLDISTGRKFQQTFTIFQDACD